MSLLSLAFTVGPSSYVVHLCRSQGNLKTFLVRHQWEEQSFKQRGLVASMACDIARGVAYLHSISIAHKCVCVCVCVCACVRVRVRVRVCASTHACVLSV